MVLVVVSTFTFGWSGGWLEDWRVMLNSTQDQIKLKLKFEVSLAICNNPHFTVHKFNSLWSIQCFESLMSLDIVFKF